jgi:hypothetical protein
MWIDAQEVGTMKRRDFLVKSAGTIGAIVPVVSWAEQIPCPIPVLQVDANAPVSTPCPDANAPIAQACAALSSGQSAQFALGAQSVFDEADVAWQTAFYHDERNGFIHLLGKPANNNPAWGHQYFNTSTSTWTVVSTGFANGPGHIYGNTGMDFRNGNLYQTSGEIIDTRKVHRWRRSNAWDTIPASGGIYNGGSFVNHCNGVAYHPSLYGQNDGGLIVESQFVTCFWRESTDATQFTSHEDSRYGNREGVGLYWPAKDVAILGGADQQSGAGELLMVSPASSPSGTPVSTSLGRPPILTGGHSYLRGAGFGSLHVHPSDPNKLLLLETASNRAWTATLSGSILTWTKVSNHPFTDQPRVICSLRGGLNCIWAIGTNTSILWKPA